jgi:hypothetical protein
MRTLRKVGREQYEESSKARRRRTPSEDMSGGSIWSCRRAVSSRCCNYGAHPVQVLTYRQDQTPPSLLPRKGILCPYAKISPCANDYLPWLSTNFCLWILLPHRSRYSVRTPEFQYAPSALPPWTRTISHARLRLLSCQGSSFTVLLSPLFHSSQQKERQDWHLSIPNSSQHNTYR